MSAAFPLGRNAKLNELMVLVAVTAAHQSGHGCDLDVIRREADRAAKLWEEHLKALDRIKDQSHGATR